jgi:hypothetical protein
MAMPRPDFQLFPKSHFPFSKGVGLRLAARFDRKNAPLFSPTVKPRYGIKLQRQIPNARLLSEKWESAGLASSRWMVETPVWRCYLGREDAVSSMPIMFSSKKRGDT